MYTNASIQQYMKRETAIQKHTCKGRRCAGVTLKAGDAPFSRRIEGLRGRPLAGPLGSGTLFSSPDGTTERPILRINIPASRPITRSSDLLTRSPEVIYDSSPVPVCRIGRWKCKLLLEHLQANAVSLSFPSRVRSSPA